MPSPRVLLSAALAASLLASPAAHARFGKRTQPREHASSSDDKTHEASAIGTDDDEDEAPSSDDETLEDSGGGPGRAFAHSVGEQLVGGLMEVMLQAQGVQYQQPRLVLFSDAVQSACGNQSSAVGPFYCPPDQRVYLDLTFFDELGRRFGAPGDFAQAYVVAHEVGHHVQNLLGISDQVHAARGRMSRADANALSVLQELQADCFAGIWAHHAQRQRQVLEEGDIEEGLAAASAIGDDTLQRRSQGRVVPESFTHGSAAQRVQWFRRGFEQGTLEACDTFGAASRGR